MLSHGNLPLSFFFLHNLFLPLTNIPPHLYFWNLCLKQRFARFGRPRNEFRWSHCGSCFSYRISFSIHCIKKRCLKCRFIFLFVITFFTTVLKEKSFAYKFCILNNQIMKKNHFKHFKKHNISLIVSYFFLDIIYSLQISAVSFVQYQLFQVCMNLHWIDGGFLRYQWVPNWITCTFLSHKGEPSLIKTMWLMTQTLLP